MHPATSRILYILECFMIRSPMDTSLSFFFFDISDSLDLQGVSYI